MNPIERRPLEQSIFNMQTAYGLDIPESTKPDQSDVAQRAREIHRFAKYKKTQFPAQNSILLFASYIFLFIKNQIYNFFNRANIRYTNDVLFLANSLKNHSYINQKQFIQFKAAFAEGAEPTKVILKDILQNLRDNDRIDRKSFLHLQILASNNCTKEVFQFLFALSSVSNIHRFSKELQKIVRPEEQLELLEMLKEAYEHSSFPDRSVQAFSTLTARLETYRWVDNDLSTNNNKEPLLNSLKSTDERVFKKAMLAYLKSKKSSTTGLEHEYYKELELSFNSIKAPNAFIHFSQAIETLSVIHAWEKKVERLETILQGMVEGKILFEDERAKMVLKDLKELYAIFGKILENEQESSVTPTAMGLEQGVLRARWKNIGVLINKLSSHEGKEDHSLCGCMFDQEQKKDWPGVEIQEITPSVYEPQRNTPHPYEKKPTILGFYCNWGNGHRSAMTAIAHSLGKEFHIATVDLPQTALLPLDPIHKIAGGDNTITSMYNTLVASRAWSWITWLRNMGSGPTNAETDNQYKALIREQILKERPDIVMIDYGAHAHYVVEVAQELGIPSLRVSTDIDTRGDILDTIKKPEKHFKKLIPYPVPEIIEFMKTYYSEKQLAVSGYPVNPIFYKTMQDIKSNPERISQIRQKYGIQEDEVVYMISNGGCGNENPFPEWFAKTAPNQIPKGRVFCMTGRNTESEKTLKKFFADKNNIKNPELTFDVKGFISDPAEMAELVALTAATATNGRRGVFIGKAGGGSVAEALCMGAEMLIDMQDDNGIPWEQYTANLIKEKGLGNIIKKEGDFINLINERTSKTHTDEEYAFFRDINPEEKIYTIVKEMIQEAREDVAFKAKNTAWKTNAIFTREITPQGTVLNYFDSLNTLNSMLKGLDSALKSDQSIVEHLKTKPAKIDFSKMELVPTDEYDKREARLAVRYFINQLEKKEVPHDLLNIASLYLKLVAYEHGSELAQDLKTCKRNPFLMEIAYLDRLLVAKKQPDLQDIEKLYKTPLAKAQLKAWIDQKLRHNRNNDQATPLLERDDAIRSFVQHPDQYNWLTDLHIERSAARFNHKLSVNEKGEVMLLFAGKETSVAELMNQSIISIGKRIVHSTKGTEYIYRHDVGLTEVTDATHPDLWQGELPLFEQKKQRKTTDYRLEIITDNIADGEGVAEHAWIRLKTPNGEVYSVGKFWDPDISFPELQKTVLLPGNLKAGDTHEFLKRKKTDIRTTKIDLGNEANFNKMKAYIEKLQKDGNGFNVINQNSVSFIEDLCKQIDLPVENKVSMTEHFLPIPLFLRKFFIIHSWTRNISLVILYPITLITHLVLGIFGAFKKHFLSSPNTKPLFYSVESFFDPETSLIASPHQLEAWQACMDDGCYDKERKNKVIPLEKAQAYAKRISRAKLIKIEKNT